MPTVANGVRAEELGTLVELDSADKAIDPRCFHLGSIVFSRLRQPGAKSRSNSTCHHRASAACGGRLLDEEHFLVRREWPVVVGDDCFQFVDNSSDRFHCWLDLL